MSYSSPRVLIVDDEAPVRRQAVSALRDHNYRVDTAENGQEGLERLQKGRPDLILLDLVMPKMDGFEMHQHLRADASTADVPIIIMTFKGANTDLFRTWGDSATRYLEKPFTAAELLQLVTEMLNPDASE